MARDVTGCAFVGSTSGTGGDSPRGFFSAGKRTGNPNAIIVATANTGGIVANEPFHVAVFC